MADVPIYINEDSNQADASRVFITNFEVSSIGTTEIPVALFRNPSGSGKTVKLIRLTISNMHTVTSFIRVRAYASPTVTSDGTGLDELCTKFGGSAGTATAFSSPTVSANGTRIAQWVAPAFATPAIIPLDQFFILPETATILLTAQADGTNRVLGGSLIWSET
jgi:hypothetical protein